MLYERGTNLTTIGAISLSGFKGIMTVDGGCDKNVFKVFIQEILLPNLWGYNLSGAIWAA